MQERKGEGQNVEMKIDVAHRHIICTSYKHLQTVTQSTEQMKSGMRKCIQPTDDDEMKIRANECIYLLGQGRVIGSIVYI